jgi:hypothetical protein
MDFNFISNLDDYISTKSRGVSSAAARSSSSESAAMTRMVLHVFREREYPHRRLPNVAGQPAHPHTDNIAHHVYLGASIRATAAPLRSLAKQTTLSDDAS